MEQFAFISLKKEKEKKACDKLENFASVQYINPVFMGLTDGSTALQHQCSEVSLLSQMILSLH